ncbi:MAG: 1-(5-phosphoribosyl)-5-[(5-phosphoribosylamino)methylideneamino]imidazole-4-carboxamide isomerase [Candidatus Helarchaeota archaeon]
MMLIIPAIDIQNGKCVRLLKGNLDYLKIYYDDPLVPAKLFVEAGAKAIHIVDLDGAYGKGNNYKIIKQIIDSCPVEIQVGGGIRSIEKVEELYSLGVERIICGTAAINNPEFVRDVVDLIGPKHIMIALDHRNGELLTHGWQENTKLNVFEIAKEIERNGAGFILFSSADVDGTLLGPDIKNTRKMVNSIKIPVIAAGGISSIKDISEIEKTGVYGVVIGKAIYEKNINLKELLKK